MTPVLATRTVLSIVDNGETETTPLVREEMCAWLRAHGFDPMRVPATCVIHRDEGNRTVSTAEIVVDERGRPEISSRIDVHGDWVLDHVTQVRTVSCDSPPNPWPDAVVSLVVSDA